MPPPKQIVARFSALDAHDDTVEGFVFIPPINRDRRSRAKVEITLFRHWTGERRVIQFLSCANVGLSLDADVLQGNAPSNTCCLEATSDRATIEAAMRRHKRSWNVTYQKSIDPLPAKLVASKQYVMFRVRMFGGILEILARSFAVKRMNATKLTAKGQ